MQAQLRRRPAANAAYLHFDNKCTDRPSQNEVEIVCLETRVVSDSRRVVDTAGPAAYRILKHGGFLAFGEMRAAAKTIVVGLRARTALSSSIVTRAGQNKVDNKDVDCCTKQQDEGRQFQQRAPRWHKIRREPNTARAHD